MRALGSKYIVDYELDGVVVYSEALDFLPKKDDYIKINNIEAYIKRVEVRISTAGNTQEISFAVICYQVGGHTKA